MHRVFIEPSQVDMECHRVFILGGDVNHIKNVLRMKKGEELDACESVSRRLYRCMVEEFTQEGIECRICFVKEPDTELSSKIYLFQGLPKGEKLELIIQKAVELGAAQIIPVKCTRSVVKLDEKKAAKKTERWQQIAKNAAEQSRRSFIPQAGPLMDFKEAVEYAKKVSDKGFIPYELTDASAMDKTRALLSGVKTGESVAVFIGPEGGFEEEEVKQAVAAGIEPITLGKRILRTETAAITVLSWLNYILG